MPDARDDYAYGEDIKVTKNVDSSDLAQFTGPEIGRTAPFVGGYSLEGDLGLLSLFTGGGTGGTTGGDDTDSSLITPFIPVNTSNANNQLNDGIAYPNDQTGFGNWLYGSIGQCKANGKNCIKRALSKTSTGMFGSPI